MKPKLLFNRLTNFCVKLVKEYLPDPFIFCALLTFLVFLISVGISGAGPVGVLDGWTSGFWSLLAFSMQMALILVFGHAMASSYAISSLLKAMANKLKTPSQGIIAVSFISLIASWLNWGFGLVIGAIFAKEVAKVIKGVDYRLLIASAYSGFLVWHGGLSGSIPLTIATNGNIEKITQGVLNGVIPVSQTLFSPINLTISALLILTIPFLNNFMHPSKDEVVSIDPGLLETQDEPIFSQNTWAERLENSKWISYALSLMAFSYVAHYFFRYGFKLDLNIVNFIFLFTGVLLHGTPRKYLDAIKEGTTGATGVLLQFPFYGGIMGMMLVSGSEGVSVAGSLSRFFVEIANTQTFPLFTFLSAGLVNFFVPSGGGQWAVQAPIMLPAAKELGVSLSKTALAISWGDAWTNMIQPFWALPALGIAGLSAKDIMGFCLIVLFYSGIVISGALFFIN